MEEHGSNVALLRHRDQTISELQAREAQVQDTVKRLQDEVRAFKDGAARAEHKVALYEREVSFLQAMVVSLVVHMVRHYSRIHLFSRPVSTRRMLSTMMSSKKTTP